MSAAGYVDAKDRYSLEHTDDQLLAGVATVRFALPGPTFRHFPVRVYVYRKQKDESTRIVGESPRAFARAHVELDGKPLLVEYDFDQKSNSIQFTNCWQGMDLNRDGEIDHAVQSGEYRHAQNEYLVFRVENRYVSTASIDLEKREVVLRAHDARDYHTIEFRTGVEVPDFSFTDLADKSRKLSDLQGKYLLLDFWATWCGPCVAELPYIKKSYERFRQSGFEVLGMNFDEDPGKLHEMVSEKGLNWTQATRKSIEDLVETRFRIASWPTYLLIDGRRQIVIADSNELRGENLTRTLERLFR